jgi:hypothetical protein
MNKRTIIALAGLAMLSWSAVSISELSSSSCAKAESSQQTNQNGNTTTTIVNNNNLTMNEIKQQQLHAQL